MHHHSPQLYDIYFLICKVEYPYEKQTLTETAYITLPGTFVDLEFCAYMEFPSDQQYFNYNAKFVNGIENGKVNLFLKELPAFIQVEKNPFEYGKE